MSRTLRAVVLDPAPAPNVPGCLCPRDADSDGETEPTFCDLHARQYAMFRKSTLMLMYVDLAAALHEIREAAIAEVRGALLDDVPPAADGTAP